jgi:hypothetical protein
VHETAPDGRFALVDMALREAVDERRVEGWVASTDLTREAVTPAAPDPWDVESDPARLRFVSGHLLASISDSAEIGEVSCASGRVLDQTEVAGQVLTHVALAESIGFERAGFLVGAFSASYPGSSECKRILRMPDPPHGNTRRPPVPDQWVAVREGDGAAALERAERILTAGKTLYWLNIGTNECEPWPVRKSRDPSGSVTISGTVRGQDGKPTRGDVEVFVANGGIGLAGLGPGWVDALTPVSERAGGVALVWPANPDEGTGAVFAFHPGSVNMWFDDAKACQRDAATRAND